MTDNSAMTYTMVASCAGHIVTVPASLALLCKSDGIYAEYKNGAAKNLGSGMVMTLLTVVLSLVNGFF